VLLKCCKYSSKMIHCKLNLAPFSGIHKAFFTYVCKKIFLTSNRILYEEMERRDNVVSDAFELLAEYTKDDEDLCSSVRCWGFWELFNPQHPTRMQGFVGDTWAFFVSPLYPLEYFPAANVLCNIMFAERKMLDPKLRIPDSVDLSGYIEKLSKGSTHAQLVMECVGIATIEHKTTYATVKCSVKPECFEIKCKVTVTKKNRDELSVAGDGTDSFAGDFTFVGTFNIHSSVLEADKDYILGAADWGGRPKTGPFRGRADSRGIVGMWGVFQYQQFGCFRIWPKSQISFHED